MRWRLGCPAEFAYHVLPVNIRALGTTLAVSIADQAAIKEAQDIPLASIAPRGNTSHTPDTPAASIANPGISKAILVELAALPAPRASTRATQANRAVVVVRLAEFQTLITTVVSSVKPGNTQRARRVLPAKLVDMSQAPDTHRALIASRASSAALGDPFVKIVRLGTTSPVLATKAASHATLESIWASPGALMHASDVMLGDINRTSTRIGASIAAPANIRRGQQEDVLAASPVNSKQTTL
eukprot:SAG22_NODE_1752_length_3659_cov_18.037360_2_plen_242_part_00